jgi:hypothetical protein
VQPQFGSPATGRPPVSPYLNLGRGGNPAINYYGVVRPQQQAALAIQSLDMQQDYLQQSLIGPGGVIGGPTGPAPLGGLPGATGGTTGYFFNYSHYYPLMRNAAVGGVGRTQP